MNYSAMTPPIPFMQKNIYPNFIFFGTPDVARDTLASLLEHGFKPTTVVTNPDKPRGRGLAVSSSPVKEFALKHGIPTITPDSLKEDGLETKLSSNAEMAIVVAYGKILPESLIQAFAKGVFNVHYSLLPKYRGASPVETALRNGEDVTGVSIQRMVSALDAGDVLAARGTSIHKDETAHELRERLVQVGSELLIQTLPLIFSDVLSGAKQDSTLVTYAPKIKKKDGLLSLSANSLENWRTYRAYVQYPGTFFFAIRNGKRIRVKITHAIYGKNTFIVRKVVPEGKREQSFDDFTRSGWVAE